MRRSRDPQTRYMEKIHKQQRALEDFAANEYEWAEDLLNWYRIRCEEIADEEYRTAAFFKNREYLYKPGSLTLLYSLYNCLKAELPPVTKENAFYQLCYRYRVYALALDKGGF